MSDLVHGPLDNQPQYGGQELFRLGMQRLTCILKSVNQRLLRELLDDRFDDPSQPQWHVSRQ